jgi:hypothetical protein
VNSAASNPTIDSRIWRWVIARGSRFSTTIVELDMYFLTFFERRHVFRLG